MKNKEVAEKFYEIADFLEMEDVDWKPRAYRRAARNIETLSDSLQSYHEEGNLEEIEGVGEDLAKKIEEYLETGEIQHHKKLKNELPVDIEALTSVEGLGPKSVKKLYNNLGITNLDELEEAAQSGDIAEVEGFGEKTQEKILDHIEEARQGQERMLIGKAFPIAEELENDLQNSENFNRVTIVGSFRRRRPTVGDIDILATSDDREAAMNEFTSREDIQEEVLQGETKSSIKISGGLQVDLRIVDEESYGAALQYFTGSKDHNVTVRTLATKKDWKLNEYGLFDSEDNKLAGATEESIYTKLQLDYIEPELREDTGEVDKAYEGELPDLVEKDEIKGDLQVHTTYSDGRDSIQDMAEKAEELGYEYLLITDHGPSLQIASGLDEEQLDEQAEEIAEVNENVDVEVLHGIEANVTEQGLDISKKRCEMLDFVVVAMHNPPENPTEKLLEVFEEYPADVFAHPQNRKITERKPLDLDLDKVMEKASEENVAIEINSQPERLDLDWLNVKHYRDKVDFVVSTDAHSTTEMEFMHLGVSQARRGWCEKADVLNTFSLEELREALK